MKTLVVLTFLSASITAQTLSINPAGLVTLSPTPERAAELYAADTPRSDRWEFVTEFAAITQVSPPTNRAKFYRAYVKEPPLKLIAITETNQTIRGTTDKGFTNITLTVNGLTSTGWCYSSSWLWETNAQGRRRPLVDRSLHNFSFRQVPVTKTTPALLSVWDDDGYVLQTNLFIGPGPFIILLPKHLQPKTNSPARSGAANPNPNDPQFQSGWYLVKHSASQILEYYSGVIACGVISNAYDGWWDGSASILDVTKQSCKNGSTVECGAAYIGLNGGPMELTGWSGCDFVSNRLYVASSEIGSYDSDSDDAIYSSHFKHVASSKAEVWIGGKLRGAESNYWLVAEMALQAPERIGGDEVIWNPASSLLVKKIGDIPLRDGRLIMQVPPEGLWLDASPSFGKMNSGWYHYWLNYVLVGN